MELNLGTEAVLAKTRELCQTIVDQPDFAAARHHIDRFLADEQAKRQYQTVAEKSEDLHDKQRRGVPLSSEEIADFEQHRSVLMNNPVARDFLAAQEEVQTVQDSVRRYVARTLELGRVPTDADLAACGHGCNCGH